MMNFLNFFTLPLKTTAVRCFMLGMMFSVCNDLIFKTIGDGVHPIQVIFLCFCFSSIVVLLGMIQKQHMPKTRALNVHILRSSCFAIAMCIWCFGLQYVTMATAIVINFSIPFLIQFLARIYLGEKAKIQTLLLTMVGMVGGVIAVHPTDFTMSIVTVMMMGSTVLYALFDVCNKKLSDEEGTLNMLFYTALLGSAALALPSVYVWQSLTLAQWGLVVVAGSFLTCVWLFEIKAYKMEQISFFGPYYYIELLFASALGFVFLREIPDVYTLIGALIIIGGLTVYTKQTS